MTIEDNTLHGVLVICFVLLVFVVGLSVLTYGAEGPATTDEFVEVVKEEYGKIEDLTASVEMLGTDPSLTLKLWAITDTRLLRLEYLEPPQMKGQFFLLKENFLYQYMPARDLVIKKDLTQENIPIKAANLTPDYLLELIGSEELEIRLIGRPLELTFPNLKDAADLPQNTCPVDPFYTDGLSIYTKSLSENYVLEIVPTVEKYQFARQIIVFDPEDYLPVDLLTYLPDDPTDPIRTKVLSSEVNVHFPRDEVVELPQGAEVISG